MVFGVFGVSRAARPDRSRCAAAKAGAALLVLASLAAPLSGCSVDPIPQPVPAMQLIAPSTVPVPQDIVVPLPVPAAPPPGPVPRAPTRQGVVKVGKPYAVAGNWYYPAPGAGYDEQGIASWYGPDFNGKSTANGEIYNMHHLSAAHPTLPMPSYVEVTNTANGRRIVVRVNDRGPYKAGRIIDLSKRAGQLLGVTRFGTAPVRVRYLKMAPLVGEDTIAEQFLLKQPWYQGARVAAGQPPALPSPLRVRATSAELPAMDAPGAAAWQAMLQQQ